MLLFFHCVVNYLSLNKVIVVVIVVSLFAQCKSYNTKETVFMQRCVQCTLSIRVTERESR